MDTIKPRENKTADLNVRMEPSAYQQMTLEAHLQGQTVSRLVLDAVYIALMERNLKAAKSYEEMRKTEPDPEKRAKLLELFDDSVCRSHMWIAHHKGLDAADVIYKDIEALESYLNLLQEKVNAE